jgi:hypothetical protein
MVFVVNAFNSEGINTAVFSATTRERAMEMISEIVELDEEIVSCNICETYLNVVNDYVTLH